MPMFRAGPRLVYYAHVPKCGGSAVEEYLAERFGAIGLFDKKYLSIPEAERWSKTSPQHIDATSLSRLIPPEMFDAIFTIVRHPVARLVSAYHFQLELERTIPEDMSFTAWLGEIETGNDPFAYDNHMRPMAEIVPEGADVFYLEHGLDALVPWFDALTGNADGPRAIAHINKRGEYAGGGGERVRPGADDLATIARLYAEDFARFGYTPEDKAPKATPPVLSAEALAARDRDLAWRNSTLGRLSRKVRRKVGL